MRICSVIAEYNPFHNGHRRQLELASTMADVTVCIMSGSFVQRGEPAVYDKWTRARAAVKGGADLVLELPAAYVLGPAETFAYGAVASLSAIGMPQTLLFGSECGDLALLQEAACCLEDETYSQPLQQGLKQGLSFPAALAAALPQYGALLSQPNNILGIAYLRAIRTLESPITPATHPRWGVDHDDTAVCGELASASKIRSMLLAGQDASAFTPLKTGQAPLFLQSLEPQLRYALRTTGLDDLKRLPAATDGLAERIYHYRTEPSLERLLYNIKTKRYTMSRIKRTFCNILLKNTINQPKKPEYLRILALNTKGCALVRAMKKTATVPIITKLAAYDGSRDLLDLDILATDLCALVSGAPMGRDFTTSPIVQKTPAAAPQDFPPSSV